LLELINRTLLIALKISKYALFSVLWRSLVLKLNDLVIRTAIYFHSDFPFILKIMREDDIDVGGWLEKGDDEVE